MMTLDEILTTVEGHLYEDEARLLHRLAREVPPGGLIVEIGSFRGRSTCVLAAGCASGQVYAIDPHYSYQDGPATFGRGDLRKLRANLKIAGVAERVQVLDMSSHEALESWDPKRCIDLLWIDGDHSYEGCKFDFDAWSPRLVPRGVVALHDSGYETVGRVIDEAVAAGWTIIGRADSTIVLRRSS